MTTVRTLTFVGSLQLYAEQCEPASTTLSLDLSKDWTNSTVTLTSIPKPNGFPTLDVPSLWYHAAEDILYTGFTGEPATNQNASDIPNLSLWALKPDNAGSGTWTEVIDADNTSAWGSLVYASGGLQGFDDDSAYVLGGVADKSGVWIPGLVEFDMTLQNFTNHSTSVYTASQDLSGINKGVFQYVPSFGPQGIYVVMGGWTRSASLGFSTVTVYDPAAQGWYQQQTTGTGPSDRVEFCSAGVNSTNSTFEIFVYAGWDGNNYGNQDDTIFILSLPAFHWIQVDYTPKSGRFAHTCNSVGGSQILIVGGLDSNPKLPNTSNFTALIESDLNSTADPFTQGLAVFDMTTLEWATQYTANKPAYEWSAPIKEFYQDANKAYVQNLVPNVLSLIDVTHFASVSNTTNTTSNSPGKLTPEYVPEPGHKSNTGAIVGGVVGGVVAVALLVARCVWRRRRRRSKGEYKAPESGGGIEGPYGYVKSELPSDERQFAELGGPERLEMEATRGEELEGHERRVEMPG